MNAQAVCGGVAAAAADCMNYTVLPISVGYGSLKFQRKSQDDAKGNALKKTVSFHMKHRIHKSPIVITQNIMTTKPMKKSFKRSGSFNDSDKVPPTPKKNNDRIENLVVEKEKVFRGLRFIQDAVDKGILELFHGSVTIVLDQIIELHTVIQNCLPNHESAQLKSEFDTLHQYLATLMGLSDPVLLSGEKTFSNKQEATDLVSSMKSCIQNLVHLAEEIARLTKSKKPSSENRNEVVNVDNANVERLVTRNDPSLLTHSKTTKCRSAENLLNICETRGASVDDVDGQVFSDVTTDDDDKPPPKPPKPHYLWNVGKFNSMPKHLSVRYCSKDIPPPLPEKERRSVGFYEASDAYSNLAVPSPTHSIGSAFSASLEDIMDEPPPKPPKTRSNVSSRHDSRSSQYDNDSPDEISSPTDFADVETHNQPSLPLLLCDNFSLEFSSPAVFESCDSEHQTLRRHAPKTIEVHQMKRGGDMLHNQMAKSSEGNNTEVSSSENSQVPPPIPPKKHVQAYLSAFGDLGSSSRANMRHSVHVTKLLHHDIHENQETWHCRDLPCRTTSLQPSLKYSSMNEDCGQHFLQPPKQSDQLSIRTSLDSGYCSSVAINNAVNIIPEVEENVLSPDSDSKMSFTLQISSPVPSISSCDVTSDAPGASQAENLLQVNVLEEEKVTSHLVFKKSDEDGPEVRGGSVDVLIVHATTLLPSRTHSKRCGGSQELLLRPGPRTAGRSLSTSDKEDQFLDIFLMTYRTFISPCDLIKKLVQRYKKFSKADDAKKKELAKNAYQFLLMVVNDLCRETDKEVLQILREFVCHLVKDGELQLAKKVRELVVDKSKNYLVKQAASQSTKLLSSYSFASKARSIVDFKAINIAEQMTLLDAELFDKIEIPEVLRWSREQLEEHSPNLTKFTEHFNKMSYWCRTRILEQEDPKERERLLAKFIKVLKHLRRLNNFNSFLAILSAVDSAPVRRLEWQRHNVETLKEFCELIDSSSSFHTYRQALSEAKPPCIPYIGLVLQDLTFVNLGNRDYLPDKNINFSKCWQYFTIIIENMSRFRKCAYDLKKNEKIIALFNNFDYYLSEESLWQLSEMIKPRGSKTPVRPID